MSVFEQELPPFRIVETHHGDDLQAVASRELGDANRWPELVWINSLSYPYITDDPRRVGPGVLLSGSQIKVPAPSGVYTADTRSEEAYGRDAVMRGRRLAIGAEGDLEVVAGRKNLVQQLRHRIDTPRGQARRHPEYGCMTWHLLGTISGPTASLLGAEYVKSALLADYRVASVISATAEVAGDAIRIEAKAEAVDGGSVDVATGS